MSAVISSRIRFARNIKDYPFYSKLDSTSAKEIIEKVRGALPESFTETDFSALTKYEALSYIERHKVSHEFVSSKLPHSLFECEDTAIMTCEEDHIRLQCIKSGLCLEDAYNEARKTDELLISKMNIAYSDSLGFLTHCPTNLGTGMRASVMMFLPSTVKSGKLHSIISSLSKLGVTVRGLYGEGSTAVGSIFQISNTKTLGVDEETVIKNMTEIAKQLCEIENECREKIYNSDKLALEDKVARSIGILKYAKMLDSTEFISHYEIIRMGAELGICDVISVEELDRLFYEAMPANIMKLSGKELSERERDVYRAEMINNALIGNK